MSTKSKPQTTTTTSEPPGYLRQYYGGAAEGAYNNYATNPYVSPVEQNAQDYATKVLGGGFMGSNPYLDATFNKAQGAVTNAVQSNFGLAGRNARGVDAAGFAGDQYNDLATRIYGGDYEAERARMQQLVPQARDLGTITDPGRSLDEYISRLTALGGGTTTSTTPTSRNPLAGAVGGASAMSWAGPWGVLGGGILGGLYG